MQLQRQSIRVMEESHLLSSIIVNTNRLTFNAYLRQLIHRLLHALHTLAYVFIFLAAVLGTMNVVGGYVVTDRMLEMFKSSKNEKKGESK